MSGNMIGEEARLNLMMMTEMMAVLVYLVLTMDHSTKRLCI